MQIIAAAERTIDAPAAHVYDLIRDFRVHHPNFLPPQFSDFRIECGGVGAGTVHRFRMTLGGRTSEYRVRVGEPQPGRMLIESDKSRRILTTFTVDPERDGRSRVRIQTRWYTDGLAGILQRLIAPRMLANVYRQELELLNRYAGGQLRLSLPDPGARPRPGASAR